MGILGLPNVGKSSLFNALTREDILVDNRPFSTIEPNLGVVKLPDHRLDALTKLIKPKKTVNSVVKFLDIAGLVKGASQGAGLGNKFLENIRSVDAICLVVRAFEDNSVISVNSSVDPVFEAEIVLCELIYSDLFMVENIMKKLKSNDPKNALLEKIRNHFRENKLLREFNLSVEERNQLKIYSFLTNKPLMILANTDDSEKSKEYLEDIKEYAKNRKATFLDLNVKFENEINSLTEEEQKEFLESLGRQESGLDKFISVSFAQLNLKTFFTAGEKEVRSWTFKANSTAPECAGLIHSDIQKGFIKVEVVKYEDFIECGGYKNARQQGKLSLEGKTYIMQDGDIVDFKFNV